MNKKLLYEVCKKCIEKYGEEKQMDIAIEEMSELIKAICKWKRNTKPSEAVSLRDNVIEELVDVNIVCQQLYMMFVGNNNEEFDAFMRYKLNRQKERLEE